MSSTIFFFLIWFDAWPSDNGLVGVCRWSSWGWGPDRVLRRHPTQGKNFHACHEWIECFQVGTKAVGIFAGFVDYRNSKCPHYPVFNGTLSVTKKSFNLFQPFLLSRYTGRRIPALFDSWNAFGVITRLQPLSSSDASSGPAVHSQRYDPRCLPAYSLRFRLPYL